MKLNYELVGTLNITADEIDITDPSYDKDVWCRTRKPITPGEYNCYVGIRQWRRPQTIHLFSDTLF